MCKLSSEAQAATNSKEGHALLQVSSAAGMSCIASAVHTGSQRFQSLPCGHQHDVVLCELLSNPWNYVCPRKAGTRTLSILRHLKPSALTTCLTLRTAHRLIAPTRNPKEMQGML